MRERLYLALEYLLTKFRLSRGWIPDNRVLQILQAKIHSLSLGATSGVIRGKNVDQLRLVNNFPAKAGLKFAVHSRF